MRCPKLFAKTYGATAVDMQHLFKVSLSTAEKWLSTDRKVSEYHRNAIELMDARFGSIKRLQDLAAEEVKSLTPCQMEFFENWRDRSDRES